MWSFNLELFRPIRLQVSFFLKKKRTLLLLCPPDNQRLSVGASARDVVVCLSVPVCVLATFAQNRLTAQHNTCTRALVQCCTYKYCSLLCILRHQHRGSQDQEPSKGRVTLATVNHWGPTNTYVTLQFSAGLEGAKEKLQHYTSKPFWFSARPAAPNLSKNGVYDNVSFFLICSLLFYSQGDGL
ncbi:uncharacterized protein ASPGLDRAFT_965299 [Aspergillus glaucus CBS 516.65]|uniref:Uncharacterized protein n=1 Tax=Aspergillus glaucus CBS 516.65 TaxID=1160497 RepID=A0A1L9VUG2_ASPGL|nr:hypothetical protein ASPGLDRAFT_965299 [Aspergillus glaucus CBS 516.65]OJJ87563.1 hypothetical protein ASPGLDRAFT_965299 [Aspergillus glaucus CBS 516.65]